MTKKRKKVEYRYFEMPPRAYAIGIFSDFSWPLDTKGSSDQIRSFLEGGHPGGSSRKEEARRGHSREVHPREIHSREGRIHLHNFLEVGYCRQGTGLLTVGDESFRFQRKTLCIIPPHRPHGILGTDENTSWGYLMIDAEGFLKDMLGADRWNFAKKTQELIYSRYWVLERQEHEKLEAVTERLLDELHGREEYYEESVKGLLLTLLMEIAEMNVDRGVFSCGRRDRELIAPALDFIHENFRRDIRICGLASLCCISETHFRRVFSQVMSASPAKYVNLVRIFTACEYLRKSDYSIREIGLMTGFLTLSTFNRNFKGQTGVSPRIWRTHPEKLGLHEFSENMVRIAQFTSENENMETS